MTCGCLAQSRLSERDCVSKALASHPLLAALSERVEAATGLSRQAALRPNPRFQFQTENQRSWGTPPFEYGNDADVYAFFSQSLQTAGKRGRRMELAGENQRRTSLERELLSRQIAQRVRLAYWNAAGAEKLFDLLRENGRTFGQIVDYHRARVREGAMAEADLIRVQIEAERLEIAANNAGLDAERARIQLFREMGALEFPAAELSDSLDQGVNKAILVDVSRALSDRLEMQIARQAVEQALAAERLQRAFSRPDLDFVGGYKRTSGYNTWLGGFQFNVPLNDRNQGNIAAASAEVRYARGSLAATEAIVRAEVKAARTDFETRRRQVAVTLKPMMERASESSRIAVAAYREGGADLLRLLDAERIRIDAELLYYRTLADFQQSVVMLETALGVAP